VLVGSDIRAEGDLRPLAQGFLEDLAVAGEDALAQVRDLGVYRDLWSPFRGTEASCLHRKAHAIV